MQGKSLSLICGALKWLTDFNQREKERIDAILAGKIPAASLLSETPETKDQEPSEHNSSGEELKETLYHDLVSYPAPHGLGTRLTIFDLHLLEPDWFATFDEQKAQKDAVHKLKVCIQYHLCTFFSTKFLHCTPNSKYVCLEEPLSVDSL